MLGNRGLGLITNSNFFVPQANVPGSMASFVTPAAVVSQAPIAAPGSGGLGQSLSPTDLFPQGISLPMKFDFASGYLQTYWPYLAGGALLLMLLLAGGSGRR